MPYLIRPTLVAMLLAAGPVLAPGLGLAQGTAASGTRQEAAFLSADQLSTILRARGFSDVNGVEREGDTFRIREATRYGEVVRDLRIDALTGQPREQPLLTEAQASALLRDRGYAEVTELGRDGDLIRLRAVRDGTPTELRVDARTGAVRQ